MSKAAAALPSITGHVVTVHTLSATAAHSIVLLPSYSESTHLSQIEMSSPAITTVISCPHRFIHLNQTALIIANIKTIIASCVIQSLKF